MNLESLKEWDDLKPKPLRQYGGQHVFELPDLFLDKVMMFCPWCVYGIA